ncbi:uncharacterized protein [Arachis hypogaea]|uniref:uncharacterized protein n=1 Tax=Arachis hypogaea TaxID=3818 RepID=UPI000DEC5A85|nr:uncharacterized protein LOC112709359 [Arachis hypogaea]
MTENFTSDGVIMEQTTISQPSKPPDGWNCRGASAKSFPYLIRDLRREFDANFLLLFETHLSGDRGKEVRNKLGFDGCFVEEANGHSGGIWALWVSSIWKVDIFGHNRQFIHLLVSSKTSTTWLLTAIYGSPQKVNRKLLWNNLRNLAENINAPWCLIGDFNVTLHDHERRGGAIRNDSGAYSDFQNCVFDCGLIDLGFVGWPFTWKRGNLVIRLDRALGNLDWQIQFPEACIKHLPMLKSDHAPLCLQLSQNSMGNRRKRPFHFLASWLHHPEFDGMVRNCWKFESSWSNSIHNFQRALKDWNNSVFGNISKGKKKFSFDFKALQIPSLMESTAT